MSSSGTRPSEGLATVSWITSGDYDSWYREWDAAGERVSNEAQRQLGERSCRQRTGRLPARHCALAFARIYDWLDETLG